VRYELTSKYGWVPGKRALRRLSDGTMEQPMLLLYVEGKLSPIEVVSGSFAFVLKEYLVLAGAIEYKYCGPGSA